MGPTTSPDGKTEIGIRPEDVRLGDDGIPAVVRKAADLGRHAVVEAIAGDTAISAIIDRVLPEHGSEVHLSFDPRQTRPYADGWIASQESIG